MPENETEPGAIVPSSVPKTAGIRFIFAGPRGVRAGWRLLLYFPVMFLSLIPLQLTIANGVFSAIHVIEGEVLAFGILLLGTLIFARVEHRTIADYGLPFRLLLRAQFWVGALWGFAMVSSIVALMLGTRTYSFGGMALSPFDAVRLGLMWGLGFLLVGLYEEFLSRGYLLFTLTRGIGFWPAALITSCFFASGHLTNPGENWVGVVEIILIALFLCFALRRTGNLCFAIGWHMAFDWGESFFYSTPNSGIHAAGHLFNASLTGSKWLSGGTVGPEASVFDVIVTVAGILLLAKLYPEAKYPAGPATEATKVEVSS